MNDMHQKNSACSDFRRSTNANTPARTTSSSAKLNPAVNLNISRIISPGSNNLNELKVPEKGQEKPGIPGILRQSLYRLSPKQILATASEAIKEFKRNLKGEEVCHDKTLLKERMYSRVMATFGISEVAGPLVVGPVLGLAAQIFTKNPHSGVLGTVIGDYIGAVAGFLAAFYLLNKKMYQASSETKLGRLNNLWKDTRPFLGGCAVIAAGLYAIDVGIGYGLTAVLPNASKYIPMTGVITAFNVAIAEAVYLLSAGAAFVGYSKGTLSNRALERYQKYPGEKKN